ncbi:MAG TPA: S53 family peptidase [Segeticoccus sp.]|uniref:S53 family peptidase n=1 Tax=Segeticoccus sp. TaxID=2706531 RepID=UPI002D7EE822|nr:S53 family peptidase [Segeticoccus sp.]HET8600532.1 S53 family peptidase [Segeticoccus sp.]
MRKSAFLAVTTALATATSLAALTPAVAAPSPTGQAHAARVCALPTPGNASCHALVRTNAKGKPTATSTPTGYGPADLQSAYHLAGATSGGRTVAIVDAYDDPTAEQDLATYRSHYGLPPCTTANGCFTKVNQRGTSAPPRKDAGWAQEISLDLDMVSATCPDCHILLVEADSASFANLGAAVQTAASWPGVVAISNSYGGSDASDATYGRYYDHPGIAVTASTGDNGYQGGSYPASSSYVTAVGGTSLHTASNARGWSETVWSGAGSGCSTYNTALPDAAGYDTGCSKRAMADVSAVADPYTGVAVYDSTAYRGSSGWMTFGGTSASAPIIASVYALSGKTAGYANAYPYQNSSALNDVTSGSNGSCPTTQWCTARSGWDGPTGLGTPNGVSAF